jgi:hypothetical protein
LPGGWANPKNETYSRDFFFSFDFETDYNNRNLREFKKIFRVIIKILKYISAYPLQCIFNLNLDPSRTGYGRAILLLDLV